MHDLFTLLDHDEDGVLTIEDFRLTSHLTANVRGGGGVVVVVVVVVVEC